MCAVRVGEVNGIAAIRVAMRDGIIGAARDRGGIVGPRRESGLIERLRNVGGKKKSKNRG